MVVKVIGLGGIGCAILPHIARYLAYGGAGDGVRSRLVLVDGDTYQDRNAVRQAFSELGNKAQVKAREIAREFATLSVRAEPVYVTPENIGELIEDGDILLMGVDNHKTRQVVSNYCCRLANVVLISGGNDITDGNVQVFIRKDNEDVTESLTRSHPEIDQPKDRAPNELGCEELAEEGEPQLLFMNLAIASTMLNTFYAWQQGKLDYDEVYQDILLNKTNPVKRGG